MTKCQSKGFSCSIIQFCSIIMYTLTCTLSFQDSFSLMDEHVPLLAAKLGVMVAVSLHCLWSSLQQSKLDKLPRSPPTRRDYEDKRPARYDD